MKKTILTSLTIVIALLFSNPLFAYENCEHIQGAINCSPNYVAATGCIDGVGIGTNIYDADVQCNTYANAAPTVVGTDDSKGVICTSTAVANFPANPTCVCLAGYGGADCTSCASGYVEIDAGVCIKETALIYDADKDTVVTVEESADSDTIVTMANNKIYEVLDPAADDLITVTKESDGLIAGQLQSAHKIDLSNSVLDDPESATIGYIIDATDNSEPNFLENGDFEDWDLLWKPDNFEGDDDPISYDDVTRTTDSHAGTYAASLRAIISVGPNYLTIPTFNDTGTFVTGQTVQLRIWSKESVGTPDLYVVYTYEDGVGDEYAYNFTDGGGFIGTWTQVVGGPTVDQIELINIDANYTQYTSTIATAPAGVVSDQKIVFGALGSDGDIAFFDDMEVLINGVDQATNGDFELWTSETFSLENWNYEVFGGGVVKKPEANAVDFYHGIYAVNMYSGNNSSSYIEQVTVDVGTENLSIRVHENTGGGTVRMAILNNTVALATQEYDSGPDTWGAYGGGEPTKYVEIADDATWQELDAGDVTLPVSGVRNVVVWKVATVGEEKSIVDFVFFGDETLYPKMAGFFVTGDQVAPTVGALNQHLFLSALSLDETGTFETAGFNTYLQASQAISQGNVVKGGSVDIEAGDGDGNGDGGMVRIMGGSGDNTGDGGNINLEAGQSTGAGDDGQINFRSYTSFDIGSAINEYSTDGTMVGNADDAVPTEKAVVTYVAAEIAGIVVGGVQRIFDLDDDTWIDTELNADEDILRFATGDVEWLAMSTGAVDQVNIKAIDGDDNAGSANGGIINISAGDATSPGDNNGGKITLNSTSANGAGSIGMIEFKNDGSRLLDFIVANDKNDVGLISHTTGAAGAASFILAASPDLNADAAILTLHDDYASGTPDFIFGIDSNSQASFGAWGAIETGGNDEMIIVSNVTTPHSAIFIGANNNLGATDSLIRVVNDWDNTADTVFAIDGDGTFHSEGKGIVGLAAGTTDYPTARGIFSYDNTGHTDNLYNIGLVGEASADASLPGVGLYGLGKTSATHGGIGVYAEAIVNDATDDIAATAINAVSTDVHTGATFGLNIAIMANASNSTLGNYSFFSAGGDMLNAGGIARFGSLVNTNATYFPNAQVIAAYDTVGVSVYTELIGLVGISTGDGAEGVGVYGIGKVDAADAAVGIKGRGIITASADTGNSVGIKGIASTIHSGGQNIGVYGVALNTGHDDKAFAVYSEGTFLVDGATVLDPGSEALSTDDYIGINDNTYIKVAGSGGAVTNIGLAVGLNDGQMVILSCTSDANTVTITDNRNVQLDGGVDFVMGNGDTMQLIWDDDYSEWIEISRSNN